MSGPDRPRPYGFVLFVISEQMEKIDPALVREFENELHMVCVFKTGTAIDDPGMSTSRLASLEDPLRYQKVAREHGYEPRESIIIGGNFRVIQEAELVGFRGIWVESTTMLHGESPCYHSTLSGQLKKSNVFTAIGDIMEDWNPDSVEEPSFEQSRKPGKAKLPSSAAALKKPWVC